MPDPVTAHLITKTKEVFRAFIESLALAPLNGYHYLRGLRTGLQKLPTFIAACAGYDPAFENESSPLKYAQVALFVETRAFDERNNPVSTEDEHDAAVAAVLDAIWPEDGSDPGEALRAFANSENTTSRPVRDFHLGNFLEPKVQTDMDHERRTFLTRIFLARVPVMNNDGD